MPLGSENNNACLTKYILQNFNKVSDLRITYFLDGGQLPNAAKWLGAAAALLGTAALY